MVSRFISIDSPFLKACLYGIIIVRDAYRTYTALFKKAKVIFLGGL